MLINQNKKLDSLCEQLRVMAAPVALDTEFISERRYSPRLCLVQVYAAAGDNAVEAIIDPFAVDLRPLLDLIEDKSVTKIVHAGGQDLQIFYQEFGCAAHHVFDTQIAGAFLGYGHQAGYTDLVRRVAGGPQLSKTLQFTDWAARPLSPAQVEYALDDVRYLPQMYTTLRRDLVAKGRLAWAQAEFRRAEAKAREALPPDELYRKFNLSGLSRRQLAVLRELAKTRDMLAQSLDKPASFLISDPILLQMAKHPPTNLADLRSQRGMPGISKEHASALLDALERAAALAPEQWPERNISERPDPQIDIVANLLGLIAQVRATEERISRTYLAPRDQLNALAAWWLRRNKGNNGKENTEQETTDAPPDLPLLQDWRRKLLGEQLLDMLQGRLALALDASALESVVRVVPIAKAED